MEIPSALLILCHPNGNVRIGLWEVPEEKLTLLFGEWNNKKITIRDQLWEQLFPNGYWFFQGFLASNHLINNLGIYVFHTDEPSEDEKNSHLVPKAHLMGDWEIEELGGPDYIL